MNSNNIGQIETVINIKEIIWNLLEQWKAVLITALLMTLLVSGTKYARDMKDYDAAQAEKIKEQQSADSVEEKIDDVLSSLPENERATVLTIANQNEWIAAEKEYVNNSILLNTDPTNQRTLVADYYIKEPEDTDSVMNSLISEYISCLKDAHTAEALRGVIAPDSELNYITELIGAENSKGDHEGSEVYDAVLTVNVVLPDGADAQKVEETLSSLVREKAHELSGICPHDIDLISASEAYLYNKDAVKTRTDTHTSIYNLQNYTKNMQTSLSDGQKAAVESITAIREAEKTASKAGPEKTEASDTEVSKPGISKKYALLGFVLGAMLYAFIYLLMVINKGRVNCAGDVEYYTQSRLLGEAYHQAEHKGLDALLHSRLVDKYRYHGKLDEDIQVQKAASKLDIVCRHAGKKAVSVLCMSELSDVKNRIIEAIKAKGLEADVTEIPKQTDEEYLLSLKDTVLIADDDTKASDLCSLTSQLTDYDANLLGSIYCRCI